MLLLLVWLDTRECDVHSRGMERSSSSSVVASPCAELAMLWDSESWTKEFESVVGELCCCSDLEVWLQIGGAWCNGLVDEILGDESVSGLS